MAYAPLSVSPRPANASGRNSGQVNPIGHESPAAIAKRWQGVHDPAYAYRYVQCIMQSADEVFDVISRYAIDCDAKQNGWIRAVHGPSAEAEFDAMYKGWNEAGGFDEQTFDARNAFVKTVDQILKRLDDGLTCQAESMQVVNTALMDLEDTKNDARGSLGLIDALFFPTP